MNKNKNRQKGFTILVAVVTAGILLVIAMSIGGIALKEQVLSTANKESQIAFYAADTGMECALYWDLRKGAFTIDVSPENTNHGLFSCNGHQISGTSAETIVGPSGSGPTTKSYSFKVDGIPVGNGLGTTCAIVKIVKGIGYNSSDPIHPKNDQTYTDIYSYGYNTCGPSLTRLERGIEGHY